MCLIDCTCTQTPTNDGIYLEICRQMAIHLHCHLSQEKELLRKVVRKYPYI
jgi:hypothetical protein